MNSHSDAIFSYGDKGGHSEVLEFLKCHIVVNGGVLVDAEAIGRGGGTLGSNGGDYDGGEQDGINNDSNVPATPVKRTVYE